MRIQMEKVMHAVFFLAALVSILAVALICIFLFANGLPAMGEIDSVTFSSVVFGRRWTCRSHLGSSQ